MVNSPSIRPYFLGGVALGGVPLGSHDQKRHKDRSLFHSLAGQHKLQSVVGKEQTTHQCFTIPWIESQYLVERY